MKKVSAKQAARNREAKPVRDALIAKHPRCMICGHSVSWPHRNRPRECSRICCHEIANGPNRFKALDKPYAILVLCWWCNAHAVTNKAQWPEAKQLALLQCRSPEDYNLAAYNRLVNPRAPLRITQDEVDCHVTGRLCKDPVLR